MAVVDARGLPARAPGLAGWLVTAAPGRAAGSVTIALVSDRRMRQLNRAFRGVDRATDVLSFPAEPAPGSPPSGTREDAVLGDIVIATGVAARQARQCGHRVATELRVLALHGLLHLLGHDHENDQGAMAALERRLRRRAGLTEGLIERGPRT